MGEGAWDVPWAFLQWPLQIPLCTPHHTPNMSHWYLYITLLFYVMLSLGVTRRFLMVLPPMKWTPILPQMFFKIHMDVFVFVVIVVVGVMVVIMVVMGDWYIICGCLIWSLLIAEFGYLYLSKAPFMCSPSLFSSCALVQTVLALFVIVLNTLYLVDGLWCLSRWKYSSVWVGFMQRLVVSCLVQMKLKCSKMVWIHWFWEPLQRIVCIGQWS